MHTAASCRDPRAAERHKADIRCSTALRYPRMTPLSARPLPMGFKVTLYFQPGAFDQSIKLGVDAIVIVVPVRTD